MPVIIKKYGAIVEITEIEKESPKVRLPSTRKRNDVFWPKRPDNIRRTRQICLRRVLSAIEDFGNPLLVTLTFKGDASDASYANDTLRGFQVRLRNKYPKAESIFIPELSPKGRIHFHGLIFNVPMSLGDTRQGRRYLPDGDERKTRELANLWGYGFLDAKKTDGNIRLGKYITKYITKGGGEPLFAAMRILRISRGIPREIVIRGKLAEEVQRRYSVKKATKEWEGDSIFLGKITKKIYEDEDKI